ncbi:hypothetical protein BWGOE4_31220 [Bacillus mycoides]|uniref:hypothetical protein n=1 Tax=Bacillus mycoides TaxID=1405 RepID=UPI0008935C83|nr:hypothetical protein [Bacillus mycoides]OFD57533.1 hypothetical protein BWGOE4_31220 [Bacillus mycoides]OFD63788.1 hypothetical protein BWGOE7_30390 [Bacillus mycoides]OFD95009.1 hypothetical protein BWGOE12_31030 [Bacillus mycoides]
MSIKMISGFLIKNGIAIVSLFIATITLFLNRRISRLNSYNQRGNYNVFYQEKNILKRYMFTSRISVKVDNSAFSEEIELDYDFKIVPLLGGIYRSQIFDDIGKREYIGTNRTGPVIKKCKYKYTHPKKYANQNTLNFSSTAWYSYFSANGKFDEEKRKYEKKLLRYHRYIEITDYCGNTEIWYTAFSLLLTNTPEANANWKRCNKNIRFTHYRFDDFIIVSPRDVPKNLNGALQFTKDLNQILGEINLFESKNFIEHEHINYELQRFEMKEYIKLLNDTKDYL